MHSKKIVAAILVVVAIVALTIAFRTARLVHSANESLATLMEKRAALVSELRAAEAQLVTAEQARADRERVHSESAAAPAPAKPIAPAPTSQSALIATDPKLEALELRRQRAVVDLEYGPFFRARRLSPTQIERFTANAMKRTEERMDLFGVKQSEDAAGQQAVGTLEHRAEKAYEAAQTDLLGVDGYRQLQEFLRTEVVRNVVVLGLAGAAALDGIPLTAAQGEQLWHAAIAAASPDPNLQGEPLVKTIDWSALDAQAQRILTPTQFALFTSGAAPSGFNSRWKFELDATIRRAVETDAAAAAGSKPPGG